MRLLKNDGIPGINQQAQAQVDGLLGAVRNDYLVRPTLPARGRAPGSRQVLRATPESRRMARGDADREPVCAHAERRNIVDAATRVVKAMVSRDEATDKLRIVTDGVRPFTSSDHGPVD